MKLNVVFTKDHPVGFKSGQTKEFSFIHAVRLIEEGWVEPEDEKEFEKMAKTYEDQQQDIKNKIEKRLADLKDARDKEESDKEGMRKKAHGEGSSKHARMSTDDIQKEDKPKKGGKKQ